jgi:hypothetical protein
MAHSDHFVKLWKRKYDGEDITTNLRTMGKLKREVERAKRTLSNQMTVRLEVESFFNGKDLSETLTRAKFEEVRLLSEPSDANVNGCTAQRRFVPQNPQTCRASAQGRQCQKGRG